MKEYITFKNVMIVLCMIIVLIFLAQNAQIVEVKLLFWTIAIPRSVVVIASLLIGVLVGFAVGKGLLKKRSKNQDHAQGQIESDVSHDIDEAAREE